MPFCVECGHPIAASVAFCTECGRAIQPSTIPAVSATPVAVAQSIQDQVRATISRCAKSYSFGGDPTFGAGSVQAQTRLEECFPRWAYHQEEVLAEVERDCDVVFPVDVPELWQTVGDIEQFVVESRAFQSTPASQVAAGTAVHIASDKYHDPDYYVLGPTTFLGGRAVELVVDEAAWVSGVCAKRLRRQLQGLLPDWKISLDSLIRIFDGRVQFHLASQSGVFSIYHFGVLLDRDRREPHESRQHGYVIRARTDGKPKDAGFLVYTNASVQISSAPLPVGCLTGFLGGLLVAAIAWYFNRTLLDRLPPPRWLPAGDSPSLRLLASVVELSGLLALVAALLYWLWTAWKTSRRRRHFSAGIDSHALLLEAVQKLDVAAALGRPIFEFSDADLRARIQK